MPIMRSEAKISLRVHAGAVKNEVVGFTNGVWQVRIAAPPHKGKANRELIAFLKQCLGVSTLAILKGHTTKHKIVAIAGLSQDEIIKRLTPS